MRYETDEWTASCGVHIGHHHDRQGQNCQDAVALRAWESGSKVYLCGVVCDGCGGAHEDLKQIGLSGHSEVGANLISDMIVRHLSHTTGDKPLDWSLESLFGSIKRYIDANMWTHSGPDEMVIALQQFWLTTINGFIMNDEEGYIFSCGDGCSQVNDEFLSIDQQNAPRYIAYACCPMPERFGLSVSNPPSGLDMVPNAFDLRSFDPKQVSKIMVASDGFTDHDGIKMDRWTSVHKEELPPELNGQQWGKKGRFGLKKWMNTRYARGYFSDDCGIVLAERKTTGND